MNFDRRQFLGGLGGLVAVSALPARADDPKVFPSRGRFERLALAYQHIKVGASKPFSILHISDTHFTAAYEDEAIFKTGRAAERTRTFGGRQEEAFRDSLDWAKKNADYVLHTGDLIDFQSRANFDLVKRYYGEAMFGSVGNHEFYTYLPDEDSSTRTELFKARSWPLLKAAYPIDARFSSKVVNGVNFVSIDDVFGMVQPDQVERFAAEVKKGLPIILCMHVPFFSDLIWRAHEKFWAGNGKRYDGALSDPHGDYACQRRHGPTADFIAYLKSEKLLKGILAGHLHVTVQDRFSPTAMQYVIGGNFMFHGEEVLFT